MEQLDHIMEYLISHLKNRPAERQPPDVNGPDCLYLNYMCHHTIFLPPSCHPHLKSCKKILFLSSASSPDAYDMASGKPHKSANAFRSCFFNADFTLEAASLIFFCPSLTYLANGTYAGRLKAHQGIGAGFIDGNIVNPQYIIVFVNPNKEIPSPKMISSPTGHFTLPAPQPMIPLAALPGCI